MKFIKVLIAAVVVFLLWLSAGKTICSLIDSVFVVSKDVKIRSIKFAPLGGLTIDALPVKDNFVIDNTEHFVFLDRSNNLTITVRGKSFSIGKAMENKRREYDWQNYSVKPDPFDQVSLNESHSLFFWKEPLRMNFMTGHTPDRFRFHYYSLRWQKPSGATLTIEWRFVQHFDIDSGWSEANYIPGTDFYGITSIEVTQPKIKREL